MTAGDHTRSASLTMMGATPLVEEAADADEIEDSLWGCFFMGRRAARRQWVSR